MAHIMLVDDDIDLLAPISTLLEEAGHRVDAFDVAEDALFALEQGEYDLLITDIVMPGLDGVELAGMAQRTKPNLNIVAVSGGSEALPRATALDIAKGYGIDRVLSKPVDMPELLQTINTLVPANAA